MGSSIVANAIQTPVSLTNVAATPTARMGGDGYTNANVSYLGRSEYMSGHAPIDEERERTGLYQSIQMSCETDMDILRMQKVFDLPPRSVRDTLIESFWQHCYPWTPIVDRSWLEGVSHEQVSPLLMQAILLAGSRTSSTPLAFGTPQQFYKKAKVLFWSGMEKDPIITIAAVCLLHWFNPDGPEHVSIDTSGFWNRIAVGLAYQVGLHKEPRGKPDASIRRRLWWSLVTRDCLINAGHGRPRAVHLKDADVSPPSMVDFDESTRDGPLFMAYVEISGILGDLTQCYLRKYKVQQQRPILENKLYRWIKTLPDWLRLCDPLPDRPLRPYDFEGRQLHIQYFTVITILNRAATPGTPPSTASLLSSSFVAGILEQFLARDELGNLGPIFTFYALSSGVNLLSSYRYSGLWHLAQQDINIIFKSLEELAKRWPSAIGSIRTLTEVRDYVTKRARLGHLPENNLTPEQSAFFEEFGPDLCRQWNILHTGVHNRQYAVTNTDMMTAGILQDLRTPGGLSPAPDGRLVQPLGTFGDVQGMNANPNPNAGVRVEPPVPEQDALMEQYGGIGNWLLADWDNGMPW